MSNLLQSASILLTPTAYTASKIETIKPIFERGANLTADVNDFSDNSAITVSGQTLISDGSEATVTLSINNVLTIGKTYEYEFTLSNLTSGRFAFRDGTDNIVFTDSAGTVKATHKMVNSDDISLRLSTRPNGAPIGTLSNISVKELTQANFDFTRATVATRVNSSGLIESVLSGLPRIDFLQSSSDGHWLFEPQSTNTATYSSDFSQGDIFGGSGNPSLTGAQITASQGTAPDGTNTATLLKDNSDGTDGSIAINYFSTNVTADNNNIISIFAKKDGAKNLRINTAGFDSSKACFYDIENGTVTLNQTSFSATCEDYGNGWFRCSMVFSSSADIQGAVLFNIVNESNQTSIPRNGSQSILLWGLQAESDDTREFATSYIPTAGSTVTRNEEKADNSGDSTLMNSTEGVLYAEVARFANDLSFIAISFNDESTSDVIALKFRNSANQVMGRVAGGSTDKDITVTAPDSTDFTKYALSYSTTNEISKFFIDGVQLGTISLSGVTITGLNNLELRQSGAGENFTGKIKSVAVFKEPLDNDELEALTGEGFSSFAALAAAGGFTII